MPFYKLHALGVSTKLVLFLQNIYRHSRAKVSVGAQTSEFFETTSGVKQGCLLSPLLFILYINDLHDAIGGGLIVAAMNVRLLMYADDIVLVADDRTVLQRMINNLEKYCDYWGMEVNLKKSEVMVFRNGGRMSAEENWQYKGEEIKIVNEFNYLGVTLTPKVGFAKHVERRNISAKNSINAAWGNFLSLDYIKPSAKWKLFQAVSRAIQTYGTQIWGFEHFDEVDSLQRYFIKRILKLPDHTPFYAIRLETNLEENHFYTLGLCMNYVYRALYELPENRLPHKLSKGVLRKNLFWAKGLNSLGEQFDLEFTTMEQKDWWDKGMQLVQRLRENVM